MGSMTAPDGPPFSINVLAEVGGRGIVIVEGLWLESVPEGRYELMALPLRIEGADGSPLRAVVRLHERLQ